MIFLLFGNFLIFAYQNINSNNCAFVVSFVHVRDGGVGVETSVFGEVTSGDLERLSVSGIGVLVEGGDLLSFSFQVVSDVLKTIKTHPKISLSKEYRLSSTS